MGKEYPKLAGSCGIDSGPTQLNAAIRKMAPLDRPSDQNGDAGNFCGAGRLAVARISV